MIILFILILMALGLIGCNSVEQGSKQPGETKEIKETPKNEKQVVQEFYKGKKINFIVPYGPGGGYDTYARIIAPYLETDLGATVIVLNKPGAGGLAAINEMYKVTTPDGFTFGLANGASILQAQITNDPVAQYDLTKFTWIARITAEPRSFVVSKTSGYKSLSDLMNSNKKILFGAGGVGDSHWQDALILAEAFGLDMDIITGYKGTSEIEVSMLRGELDGQAGSVSSLLQVIKSGEVFPIGVLADNPVPELPIVPLLKNVEGLSDYGRKLLDISTALAEIGRPVVAPPGVTEDKVRFLSEVFLNVMKNPKLLEQVEKQQLQFAPKGGEEMKIIVSEVLNMNASDKELFIKALDKYRK